jgi:hypothetical protein
MNIKMHPRNALLKDAGYTIEEEERIYDTQLQEVLDNVSWYLENFQTMVTYKVRWKNYNNKTPTTPYKYTQNGQNCEMFKKKQPPINKGEL